MLHEMRKNKSFSLDRCSYDDALQLLLLPSELKHLRTLDWCHGVSGVLKNIQLAKGIKYHKCNNISIYFEDIENILSGFDDQTKTGKRFSNAKKSFAIFTQSWETQFPGKECPFVLKKISKNQDTRFALHFTCRVERALESYGPLLDLMKKNDPNDLRLWLADTKYGVFLLIVFFCISRPLTLLQKLKQNWGIPG